jgi:amino-acid N-acetyltransferase
MRAGVQACRRSGCETQGGGVKKPLFIQAHPPKVMAVTLLEAANLVVGLQVRGLGLGKLLVEHAEMHAASHGVKSLYLLTTTAELFFNRLNYERIDRDAAPASIRQTSEYSSLCPQSSAFMVKQI